MTYSGKRQPVREHVFHSITRSLCPECKRVVDAKVLIRDGSVFLRKYCPDHGWHEALTSSDADWFLGAARYNKPGAIPYEFATTVDQGCPQDCGLCPEHQQHTCVGIVEITSRCNLGCPTCFADAGAGHDLTLPQIEFILDRFVAAEGQPEVLQISGGEPTIHPQILEIVAAAKDRDIRHVMLNTNGLRLAEDVGFVRELAHYRPAIYLQFDGLTDSTYRALRGRDLLDVKQRALDHIGASGITAVLVATVARGVNDKEIGDILHFALEHPAVLGVSYQPVTFSGRCTDPNPLERVTTPQVLHSLEAQTGGMFKVSDFIPVPCPHPDCAACTYAFVDGEQVVPLTRIVNVDDYLDFIVNRTGPDFSAEIQEAARSLWSMAAMMGTETTTDSLNCVACGLEIPFPSDPELLKRHFFLVQVHGFMDEHSFDVKRLKKCCIHQLLPDGRAVPFCAYNNLGHRDEVRQLMETGGD